MEDFDLEGLLRLYNPWWQEPRGAWRRDLPAFHRPVVSEILDDLGSLPQMISITGPRRVGKTTAVRQAIAHLIDEGLALPDRIVYFTFDDPLVFGSLEVQRVVFDRLVERTGAGPGQGERWFFFLDEIQRLPRWELYLKKYYDLKYPIRFVVSGSASSPIFRSSQESLLGRVKDRHLLPFRFREYALFQLASEPELAGLLDEHRGLRALLLSGDGKQVVDHLQALGRALSPYVRRINQAVVSYCREGGFPEVWGLADPVRKMEYLMEQQVRKVLYEDLMALTQYRKPENVLRFFVYLLAHPGAEINMSQVAKEVGVERRVVEDNLPRLEMTDLILRVRKFTHKPLRVRQGNIKCYPVDLALRNAVLKTWEDYTADPRTMGLYAENLVANELARWPEAIEISYYREKATEVDFVVTHGGDRHLPIEVKYRPAGASRGGLRHFMRKYAVDFGVVITRELECSFADGIACVPLRYFLLAE